MAFGMQVASGQFLAHVRYDARAGKLFKMDKRVDGGSDAVELPPGTRFAVDIGTFEAGYVAFTAQGPVRHMMPYTTDTALPPRPADLDQEGKPMFRPGFWTKIAAPPSMARGNGAPTPPCCSARWMISGRRHSFPRSGGRANPAHRHHRNGAGQERVRRAHLDQLRAGDPIVGWVDRPEALLGPRTVPLPQSAMTAQAGAHGRRRKGGGRLRTHSGRADASTTGDRHSR